MVREGDSFFKQGASDEGTGATLWAFIEGQVKPEESVALPELMRLMAAV